VAVGSKASVESNIVLWWLAKGEAAHPESSLIVKRAQASNTRPLHVREKKIDL
jgi:hypothetical protein